MTKAGSQTREQVYDFVVQYKQQHDGISPSVNDIAAACFMHPSTVRYHLGRLELAGRIRFLARRGIEVTGGAWEPPESVANDGRDGSPHDDDPTESGGDSHT